MYVLWREENKPRRNVHGEGVTKPGVPKPGSVEGRKVPDILIDTGCSPTLVRKSLVPDDKILQGEVVAISCAHGDTVLYPLALVQG